MDYLAEFSYCLSELLDLREGPVVDFLIDAGLKILLFTIGKPQLSR